MRLPASATKSQRVKPIKGLQSAPPPDSTLRWVAPVAVIVGAWR